MSTSGNDVFGAFRELDTPLGKRRIASLEALEDVAPGLSSMPYSIRILLESCLRTCDGSVVTRKPSRRLVPTTPLALM